MNDDELRSNHVAHWASKLPMVDGRCPHSHQSKPGKSCRVTHPVTQLPRLAHSAGTLCPTIAPGWPFSRWARTWCGLASMALSTKEWAAEAPPLSGAQRTGHLCGGGRVCPATRTGKRVGQLGANAMPYRCQCHRWLPPGQFPSAGSSPLPWQGLRRCTGRPAARADARGGAAVSRRPLRSDRRARVTHASAAWGFVTSSAWASWFSSRSPAACRRRLA